MIRSVLTVCRGCCFPMRAMSSAVIARNFAMLALETGRAGGDLIVRGLSGFRFYTVGSRDEGRWTALCCLHIR